jgi:hypothetical protein
MIHCPIWRPPGIERTGAPATRSTASVNSGPSIQGMGAPT